MYTQCPECSTAFRVTADVLKQAAGKVRCGGCGNAFNALEYLSETMPEQPPAKEADEALPELKPEPLQPAGGAPASISAEQSAALLKTLDELAGSDIRIEDTGVEWRVLDEDEVGDAAADEPSPGQQPVDEFLEESPTPVDQFLTDTPAEIDSPEIFAAEPEDHQARPVDELRFDDNTGFPDDPDLEDQPSMSTAPAREPDIPAEPEELEDEPEEELQGDLDLSDPDEWSDLLGEFDELVEAVAAPTDIVSEAEETAQDEPEDELESIDADEPDTLIAGHRDDPDEEPDDDAVVRPLDMDTQFALQAEAMGIDLSAIREAPEFEEVGDEEDDGDLDLDELLQESPDSDATLGGLLEEGFVEQFAVAGIEFDTPNEDEIEVEVDFVVDAEHHSNDEELIIEVKDEDADNADEPKLETREDAPEPDDDEDREEHFVPPPTEEEQTINMQIDQDLLALAVEDEDGFASTIVIPEDAAEEIAKDEKTGSDKAFEELMDTSAGFETIIMEGEFVRSALDKEKLAADAAAAAALAGAAAAERDAAKSTDGKRNYGMIGGAVLLVLLIAVQALHQSRDALATIPAFNSIVGPMYRAIGKPLSPEWDITGWRFEATRGSTDENDEKLTIFSRIGNESDKPLPYPLIGISLTDRFEETIGSRILDPAEYLPDNLDPRKLVQPGNTFNAVVTIESASEEATGFKLNVCYRESGGQLRCAIDDFK